MKQKVQLTFRVLNAFFVWYNLDNRVLFKKQDCEQSFIPSHQVYIHRPADLWLQQKKASDGNKYLNICIYNKTERKGG